MRKPSIFDHMPVLTWMSPSAVRETLAQIDYHNVHAAAQKRVIN